MRVRTARAADIEAMHAVRCRVRENRLSDPLRVTEDSYRAYLDGGAAWVAETERGIAGFAILDVPGAAVWALFVAPDAEGLGIGRALHARLLRGAAEHGLNRLYLTTAPGSRAERFYEKAGWTRGGRTAAGEQSFEREVTDRSAMDERESGRCNVGDPRPF